MRFRKSFILTLTLSLLVSTAAFSQKGNAIDTATIMQQLEQGDEFLSKQPNKAEELFKNALNSCLQINYAKGTALAYSKLGRMYFGSNINQSVEYAQKALSLFENTVSLPETKADMHLLLAEAYDEQGRTDSSAYYYFLLGDEMQAGSISKPDMMIDIYTKLAIFWVNTYNTVSRDAKADETMKSYVQKVKKYALQMGNVEDGISRSYFIQGIYYHYTNYDSARYYYHKFLDSREKLGSMSLPRKISTLCNIADTYLMNNQPNEAMPYINKVKELCNNPEQSKHLAFYIAFIGMMEGKALYQQKHYEPAIKVLIASLDKMKSTGGHLRGEVVESYKLLAASYEALGNLSASLSNKNMFINLNDSLTRKEKMDMISRLEIRYRIAEKNNELSQQKLAIAEAENKIKGRNIFIAGVLALFSFLALLLILWRRKNLHKQKLQQQNIENLQQKIKIERLNATIAGEEKERTRIARELHDGVSGLLTGAKMNFESIKKNIHTSNEEDFRTGLKLLEEAGIELRLAAQNLIPQVLLQNGLVKALEVYCENISQRNNIQVNFQAWGEKKNMDSHLEVTIYRIIQELLHNIVKHSKAANAIVQMNFQDDGGINITVEDDGVGMNKTKLTHTATGMGLRNIEERVKESGGKLDITSAEGQGTSFYIEFEMQ